MTKIVARLLWILLLPVIFLASMTNSLPDSDPQAQELVGAMTTGDFKWVDTWNPPGRLHEWFPFFKLGKDFEGSPVFLCPYGRWDFRKFVFQGSKEEKDAMETYVKYVMAKFIRAAAKSEAGSSVIIYDWDGFGLTSYAHPEAIRMTLHILSELVGSQKALNYGFCINTNYAAKYFLNIARPFLGTYLEKFEIYGTKKAKWLPRLLAKIPPESLTTQYGGTMKTGTE